MRNILITSGFLVALFFGRHSLAHSAVLMDSIADDSLNITGQHGPLLVESYSFEPSADSSSVFVVVQYNYSNLWIPDEPGVAPFTHAFVPELSYDRGQNAIVYSYDGEKTLCATATGARTLFKKIPKQ